MYNIYSTLVTDTAQKKRRRSKEEGMRASLRLTRLNWSQGLETFSHGGEKKKQGYIYIYIYTIYIYERCYMVYGIYVPSIHIQIYKRGKMLARYAYKEL